MSFWMIKSMARCGSPLSNMSNAMVLLRSSVGCRSAFNLIEARQRKPRRINKPDLVL